MKDFKSIKLIQEMMYELQLGIAYNIIKIDLNKKPTMDNEKLKYIDNDNNLIEFDIHDKKYIKKKTKIEMRKYNKGIHTIYHGEKYENENN